MSIVSTRRGAALAWSLKQGVLRIGVRGVAAIALATACAAGYVLVLQPQRAEIAAAREQLRIAAGRGAAPSAVTSSANGMNAFYATVPGVDAQFSLMERLHQAAVAQGLVLERGDYQLAAELATPLMRYEIELPVRGEYTQVRRFISAAMQDLPTLALKGVSFSRQKSDDPQLNAKISFVLYLKKDGA